MDIQTINDNIRQISIEFARERRDRQIRRHLEPADFQRLRDAGFLLANTPAEYGGAWRDPQRSTRSVSEMLRVLAQGDPSVALVASMHPAVLLFAGWQMLEQAPEPYTRPWEEQRRWVFETAVDGHWWGTIISEPGSAGSLHNTRSTARPEEPPFGYRVTGQKHFGSGSGMTSYMVTSAIAGDDSELDLFILDLRDVPWDGSAGITLVGAWDGHGMSATQSHALRFDDFPATRAAWPVHREREKKSLRVRPVACLYAAVFVGIVEIALDTARQQLERRRESLGSFEQVEWTRAEMEGWLVQQAYQGMLREVEQQTGNSPFFGKTAIAELSASVLDRLCKILGGGTFARHSPFGFWLQDVRALGFLRPPWGLAFDTMQEAIPHQPTSEIGQGLTERPQSDAGTGSEPADRTAAMAASHSGQGPS